MNGGTPDPDPVLWQHDLLYPDGSAYDEKEVALYQKLSKE
jgi:hypothetical protein